jgi:hemoglobin-like flavoprotein
MLNFDEIFTDSYKRLLDVDEIDPDYLLDEIGEIFFNKFYERFTSASPDVMKKFQNTDMHKQKRVLQRSLYHMLDFYVNKQATDYMRGIADIHSKKEKDISPQLYDLWLESLVATVRELDPKYDQDVGLAWKMVMSIGIAYMRDMYDRNE